MQYTKIIQAINEAENIAIISHINPDGDTVGSSLAIFKALKMYGKKPYIFCDNEITGKISVLAGVENYNTEKLNKYDLSIAVDCADIDRMGECVLEFKKGKRTMVIDHHKSNNKYGDINLVEYTAAATAQIMTKILDEMHLLDDEIAQLLYSGLVTDSGGFTFSSVTPETMQVASMLLKYDFKAYEICEHFLKKTTMQVFKLKSRVLNKAKFYDDGTIGIITFSQTDFDETQTNSSNTDGIINNIINIEGVRVAVSVSYTGNMSYKVSFRTGEDVDSSKLAMVFGGGGHKNAAGCRISGFYEDVIDKILKAVRDEIC